MGYGVETTINESGIFYLRVLANDHPILGSPFKVHVESALSDKIECDGTNDRYHHAEDYNFDAFYVANNVRENWKDPSCALRGLSLVNVAVRPRDRDTKHQGVCCVFVPTNLWKG